MKSTELAYKTKRAVRDEARRAGVTEDLVVALMLENAEYRSVMLAKRDALQ